MVDIMETTVMALIIHAGEARSSAMEALHFARKHDWQQARKCLEAATNASREAHKIQTALIISADEGCG